VLDVPCPVENEVQAGEVADVAADSEELGHNSPIVKHYS
jgi:hypothetical protein